MRVYKVTSSYLNCWGGKRRDVFIVAALDVEAACKLLALKPADSKVRVELVASNLENKCARLICKAVDL